MRSRAAPVACRLRLDAALTTQQVLRAETAAAALTLIVLRLLGRLTAFALTRQLLGGLRVPLGLGGAGHREGGRLIGITWAGAPACLRHRPCGLGRRPRRSRRRWRRGPAGPLAQPRPALPP